MVQKIFLISCILLWINQAQAQWKPAGEQLRTPWTEKVNPANVLPEYPRPQMERDDWKNLNGEWDYAICPTGQTEPTTFDGKILVPYCLESSLSGVQKMIEPQNELWYKRTFTIPNSWKGKEILLNFGAVDWKADVFVNDILIGSHKGGYTPFSFNITPYLKQGEQKLVVRVWDPTNRGGFYQPFGKQVTTPIGIYYTAITGIWQTVWIEPVTKQNYITSIKSIPDIDLQRLNVTVGTSITDPTSFVTVQLFDKGHVIASGNAAQGESVYLSVKDPNLWSPESPYLYDMVVSLNQAGQKIDEVRSYTAFRKIALGRDEHGIMRMQLNNQNLFHFGPLDQGWWPDGLYTAPTDEALLFDIKKTKDLGFNMIRKHMKVEPARWYYHCDREGILVWQDMPSGDPGNLWDPSDFDRGTEKKRSLESIANFYHEWQEILDLCISNPSVVVWTPFNESWGQFDTEKVAAWTKDYDPSRLVNPASGGNHRRCGDMLDMHNYPAPVMSLYDPSRANVIGEYGGIALPLKGHLWFEDKNFGYIQFNSIEEVTAEYIKYANQLKDLISQGLCGAVYTQTTDVEGEINGLITYDRRIIKVNEAEVQTVNKSVINILKK